MRAVAQRRGQPLFRARLLDAYDRQCAITGCSALEVLEAAHVLPYKGDHTNRVDNGLLLRADLHTLFDCQLLWITADNTVALAPALLATDYASLQGQPLRLPTSSSDHPNPAHLAAHAAACVARHSLSETGSSGAC
ncbi:MAG: HNH endonuclease [Stenotrophomonas sp.]|nr:HNH endonuclease [Stenotrophomonas sp.]